MGYRNVLVPFLIADEDVGTTNPTRTSDVPEFGKDIGNPNPFPLPTGLLIVNQLKPLPIRHSSRNEMTEGYGHNARIMREGYGMSL